MTRAELAAAIESLRHMKSCADCAEDGWDSCPEGREANALLAAYDSLPEEKGETLASNEADAAWRQAYKEISKIPLSQIKGDLFEAIQRRADDIRASRTPPSGSAEGRESGSEWLVRLKAYNDLGMKIEQRIKSGNSVPCERFHLTVEEWKVIEAYDEAVEDSMTAMAWEVGLLRQALVRAGNATDGSVSEECSSEFLSHVGEEVELCIATLRKRLADDTAVRVPREPTEAMLDAGCFAFDQSCQSAHRISYGTDDMCFAYKAMLSAAEAER